MKTVIGFFPNQETLFGALQIIDQAQIPVEEVSILSSESKVKSRLEGHQKQVLSNYARWGLVVGLLFFGLYNLVGLYCDCGLSIFDVWIELETLIILCAFGAFLGLAVAYYIRVKRLDGSTRLYIANVQRGGVVVAIDATSDNVNTIIELLHQNGGSAIKCLETRLSQYLNQKPEYI